MCQKSLFDQNETEQKQGKRDSNGQGRNEWDQDGIKEVV